MQSTASRRALKILTVTLLLIVCGYSMSYNILSNTMDPLIREFSLTGASQGLMSSMINLGSMLPLALGEIALSLLWTPLIYLLFSRIYRRVGGSKLA